MKPYLYILIVLSVGGGIGFFIGQKAVIVQPSIAITPETSQADLKSIQRVFERQQEAYRLHDALLLMRDCEKSFLEIDGNTGKSYDLAQSLIYHHEQFKPGKSIRLQLKDLDIKIQQKLAMVSSEYVKTSDMYRERGYESLEGHGLWLLTKNEGSWQISVFSRTEILRH